ncbi:LysR substrate-binding domain-containing protein [Streptomyces cyaneogriseus]|uniref:LysR substrate-binding domain-containing protein n=1 Tax=Streptomyces cyaneogriseus TaxID=68192 RepID=UPI003D18AA28
MALEARSHRPSPSICRAEGVSLRSSSIGESRIWPLEKTVGAALLVRGPHGVTLTAAGRTLLTEGKALLAQAAQTAARVRRSATASARVTVTGPGCDAVLLDRLVRSFNDACPPHHARASVGTVDDQLDRLRSGQADIALWRGPVPGPGFDSRLLFHERGHVLVGGRDGQPPAGGRTTRPPAPAWARGHTTEGMRRFLDHTAPQRAHAHPSPRASTPLSPGRRRPGAVGPLSQAGAASIAGRVAGRLRTSPRRRRAPGSP